MTYTPGRDATEAYRCVEDIKNFDETVSFRLIKITTTSTAAINGRRSLNCTSNPLDKLMEAIEANRKLYERLLASEREKSSLLMR